MKSIRRITALFLALCLLLPMSVALAQSDGALLWNDPEAPITEQPPAEEPPAEQPPVEAPPAEEPPVEEPPVEAPPAEEPPVVEPPVEVPPVVEPPVEEPPAEAPPVEELPADALLSSDGMTPLSIDDGDGKVRFVTTEPALRDDIATYGDAVAIEVAGDITLTADITIPTGVHVIVGEGFTLAFDDSYDMHIEQGATVDVDGTLNIYWGYLLLHGELNVNGALVDDNSNGVDIYGAMTVNAGATVDLSAAGNNIMAGGRLTGAGVTDALRSRFNLHYTPTTAAALLSATQDGAMWKAVIIDVKTNITLSAAQRLTIPANTALRVMGDVSGSAPKTATLTLGGGFVSYGAIAATRGGVVKVKADSALYSSSDILGNKNYDLYWLMPFELYVDNQGRLELENCALTVNEGVNVVILNGTLRAAGAKAKLELAAAQLSVYGDPSATAPAATFESGATLLALDRSTITNSGAMHFNTGAKLTLEDGSRFDNNDMVKAAGSAVMTLNGRFFNSGSIEGFTLDTTTVNDNAEFRTALLDPDVQYIRITNSRPFNTTDPLTIPGGKHVFLTSNSVDIGSLTLTLAAGSSLTVEDNVGLDISQDGGSFTMEAGATLTNYGRFTIASGNLNTYQIHPDSTFKNYSAQFQDDSGEFIPDLWELWTFETLLKAADGGTAEIHVVGPVGPDTFEDRPILLQSGTELTLHPGAARLPSPLRRRTAAARKPQ